jgi:hypothetical protein
MALGQLTMALLYQTGHEDPRLTVAPIERRRRGTDGVAQGAM